MFVEEIERAVMGAQRAVLPELSHVLWKGHAAGAIGDDDAQRIAELIQSRRNVETVKRENCITSQRRRVGSRAMSPASMERRRRWAASSWLPPAIAARFTAGEQAALGVVLAEIALSGRCELCHGAVAGRSGTSVSTVKRALAQARVLGLVLVEERRLTWCRNLPNIITIQLAELRTWVATRGRGLRAAKQIWGEGGGVQVGTSPESKSFSSVSKAKQTAPSLDCRWTRGIGDVPPGPRSATVPVKSTLGPLRSPYSGFRGRRVS